MKKLQFLIAAILVTGFSVLISCSDDKNDYLDYVKDGETLYLGKVDSLEVFSGKNRVQVQGMLIGDPKVNEVRIYWNNQKDSVVVPVTRTGGSDMFTKVITGLEENVYNFQVKTFDGDGNSSIMESQSAEVYGDRYKSTLFNRPIVNNVLIETDLTINYADMDLTSGVIGTEVYYNTTMGEEESVFVPIADSNVNIPDFENGSTYRYRTAFVPTTTAIDTFYTDFQNIRPIPTPVLGNAAVPFVAAETDGGRWGTLAEPWISNDAVKNHGGYGGWDEWNGNIFNVESGWGAPGIVNGKIYQVVTAEAATYQLKVTLMNTNHEAADEGGAYFVVAKGNGGLPDVENLDIAEEVLAYKRILVSSPLEYVIEFTVDETTEISVGELTTQSDAGRFANILSWQINVVN